MILVIPISALHKGDPLCTCAGRHKAKMRFNSFNWAANIWPECN